MYNIHDHGFQIFRGVFKPAEIKQMRDKIEEQFQRLSKQDLVTRAKSEHFDYQGSIPDVIQSELEEFKYIIFDERVLNCVRTLIGPEIVYFQDSTIQIGTGLTGYHKDNVSRTEANHSDWKSNYEIVRMGVYFQNTKDYSGGINIRVGSHKHANLYSGRAVNVPLETGDIVFWKLTTTHSGNAKRLKIFPRIPLLGRIQRMLPDSFFRLEQMQRMALFASYAKPGLHLDNFINYLNLREDAPISFKNSNYSSEAISVAKTNGVNLLEPLTLA